jgi:hypothetical protein
VTEGFLLTLKQLVFLAQFSFAATVHAQAAETQARAPLKTVATNESTKVIDTSIEEHRTPFETLTERVIGKTSRAVRFDWRHMNVGLGVVVGELIEYNNYFTTRIGAFARFPLGPVVVEVALSAALTTDSDSSQKLALTPYRQLARPSRAEIDINFAYALAEGVATTRASFLPAVELVFSVNLGLRYRYYFGSLQNLSAGDVAKDILAPQLSQAELDNLEFARLPGMQIDSNRYGVLVGFSLDIYFAPGLFFSPRVLIAPPLSLSGIGFWWELTLAAGLAL